LIIGSCVSRFAALFLEARRMRKRLTMTDQTGRRRLSRLVGNPITLVAFVAIAIGLAWSRFDATQSAREPEPDEPPNSGLIVRSELLYVCMPQPLIDLAKRDLEAHVASTYDDWKASLAHHGHQNVCYGLLVRAHQKNGRVVDLTFVRYPHREPQRFQELLDVIGIAAGRRPAGEYNRDYSRTTAQIASTNASRQEILERIKAFGSSKR
jgi:hypothetical protein